MKLIDWIDPKMEMMAEALYKDGIALSGRVKEIPWPVLDEKVKERYRMDAMKLLKARADKT